MLEPAPSPAAARCGWQGGCGWVGEEARAQQTAGAACLSPPQGNPVTPTVNRPEIRARVCTFSLTRVPLPAIRKPCGEQQSVAGWRAAAVTERALRPLRPADLRSGQRGGVRRQRGCRVWGAAGLDVSRRRERERSQRGDGCGVGQAAGVREAWLPCACPLKSGGQASPAVSREKFLFWAVPDLVGSGDCVLEASRWPGSLC